MTGEILHYLEKNILVNSAYPTFRKKYYAYTMLWHREKLSELKINLKVYSTDVYTSG